MTAPTFTRDGDRIVIHPDRARAREIMWDRSDAVIPTWTADVADDGACIRYTLTATRVEAADEYERPHLDIRIDAHEEVAQRHGPHAVIAVDQWRSMYAALDEYDIVDLTKMAGETVSVTHRWVAALLRVSAPLNREQVEWLSWCHISGMEDSTKINAVLACPPLSLVTP
jgi:hypothetical protein